VGSLENENPIVSCMLNPAIRDISLFLHGTATSHGSITTITTASYS